MFLTQDASEKLHYFNFIGTVNYVDEDRMVVILPGASALMDIQNADRLGVQLYFDETSYKLMFEALAQVIKAKNNRLAEPVSVLAITLASLNKASLMRISNSVARSFNEFIFWRMFSRLFPLRERSYSSRMVFRILHS